MFKLVLLMVTPQNGCYSDFFQCFYSKLRLEVTNNYKTQHWIKIWWYIPVHISMNSFDFVGLYLQKDEIFFLIKLLGVYHGNITGCHERSQREKRGFHLRPKSNAKHSENNKKLCFLCFFFFFWKLSPVFKFMTNCFMMNFRNHNFYKQ